VHFVLFKQMSKQHYLHQTITQYVLSITFHVSRLYHDGRSITDKAINVHFYLTDQERCPWEELDHENR
jgi:hypothetical protein